MIAIFLITTGTTMATMVLISLWMTRREHASGLRRRGSLELSISAVNSSI